MTLYNSLIKIKDNKYQKFQASLIPNIPKETIIGIRAPELRKIAKEVFESSDRDDFLNDLPHKYFEENVIHLLVISSISDFDECIFEIERFLPYMNCWALSDQKTPKAFKKNHKKLLPYIKKWIDSDHIYTSRYGIKLLMAEFLDEDFKKEYLRIVSRKRSDDYYLNMMIAWYFATALAKKYDETIIYFEKNRLDKWVHNKAIQKAIESYRVSEEHKEYLRSLKRK